jgi:hypothetical protein
MELNLSRFLTVTAYLQRPDPWRPEESAGHGFRTLRAELSHVSEIGCAIDFDGRDTFV